jgi:Na+/melibiose symporter-like transporter
MGTLGYVNNAHVDPNDVTKYIPCNAGEVCTAINVAWLGFDVAISLRTLIPCLFLVAGIFQFVGLGLVYNLDKKSLAKMNEELRARHEAEEEKLA